MGTAAFAVPTLRALLEAGHELPLVVTQPDRPGNRLRLTPPPVKVVAQELGLAVFQPERIRAPEAVDRLAAAEPELVVVVAYGQIIPSSILELPRRGVLNVHASLLPRWRGAAPIAHAILAGDQVTGVTIMVMDEQLDHGPILATRDTPVGDREDAAALAQRLAPMGAQLLVETLPQLGSIAPREQDHQSATLAPKLKKEDGELGWELDAAEIDRRVRAFQPWPGVTLPFAGARVKMLRGLPAEGDGAPGEVLAVGAGGVEVAAGRGSYVLEEVQPPGRRPLPARILLATDA
ncbi:methionyl-tRNA formyltransferase [Candidatus Nephthysia bennettiae]|uniref:methionyl-tRNA formyltransferase n=1 Tax=Candidatus Nephthysia bennettiae TaxID=3127016 RepID=UPI0030C698E3